LPNEGFIAIVGCAVEVSVSELNCLIDDLRGEFFWDFPSAETGRGKGGAIGKEVV
jgi:hypothetical protein